MEQLKKLSERRSGEVSTTFRRYLYHDVEWDERLIVVLGSRGTGKTTLLLQLMKDRPESIYLSLDNIYFEANRLIDVIDRLYEEGYRNFYIDEVHRYSFWSKDLKNAYDNYAGIRITATGSSLLEISKGREDLSRRAVVYHLQGLSFREFLVLEQGLEIPKLSLETILHDHGKIASEINDRINILTAFNDYLQHGYYPFFKEGKKSYAQKLRETINMVLEVDIPAYEELNYATVRNMKKLLYVISQSVPFKPNVSKLAEQLNVTRNTLLKILDLLDRAQVLLLLKAGTKGVSFMQKPEKIYLQNTNISYVLAEHVPDTGNLRETFFYNQVQYSHVVTTSKWGDFMVDGTYVFEIGGPSKTNQQIAGVPNAFIAADGIKGGAGSRIPLWLFGFLY